MTQASQYVFYNYIQLMHGKSNSSSSSSSGDHHRVDQNERVGRESPSVPSLKQPQSRAWVFTLNNHNSVDAPRIFQDTGAYCIWQEEKGENGTPHLQGYLYFPTGPRKLLTLKSFLPTAHFEPRRGTHEQARDYASKDDTRLSGPFTFGSEPTSTGQGARTDLISLKRSLDDDLPMEEVWSEHFTTMLKYYKGAHEYKRVKQMAHPRKEKTVCFVLFGHTGCGKTHMAKQTFPDAYWVTKPNDKGSVWFDGYDGKSPIIIDEFYGWLPYDLLLRLCDHAPLQLPTKGSFTGVAPKYIVFTSNKSFEQWYNYAKFQGGTAPLERRLEVIIEFRTLTEANIWKQPGKPAEMGVDLSGDSLRTRFAELF